MIGTSNQKTNNIYAQLAEHARNVAAADIFRVMNSEVESEALLNKINLILMKWVNEYINIKNRGGVNMDKLNINDFPSLDGVSLIPTKTLELMIDIYNKEVEKENILYEDKVKYKASLVKEGKSKAYNEDEFLDLLKKEGL